MMKNNKNPATLAAGRAPEMFSLAAVNTSENTPTVRSTQELRADFVARRCNLSREIAQLIAPLAFGLEARS